MDLLPAIDLRNGSVVRLERGDFERQTTYSSDPARVAADLVEAGASWIHVVDLDAARSGVRRNAEAIAAIRKSADEACGPGQCVGLQLGGGIRDRDAIEQARESGADRLVIGSAALRDWDWFEGLLENEAIDNAGLALGLDARNGRLSADGWTRTTEWTAVELARRVAGSGLGAIVYTDIARDGMLAGVNLEATRSVLEAGDVGVVASGGVKDIEDILACRDIGCLGTIVGKALYEGRIDLSEAIARLRESGDCTRI